MSATDKAQDIVDKVKDVALGEKKQDGAPADAKPKGQKKEKKNKGGDAAAAGPLEV